MLSIARGHFSADIAVTACANEPQPTVMTSPASLTVKAEPPIQFLFFREDGRTFGIAGEPTAEDFEHARTGLHVIVRLGDLRMFDRGGEWTPMGLGRATPAGGPPYHVPAEFVE